MSAQHSAATNRRSVLRGMGIVAAAGGLAACGSDSDTVKSQAADAASKVSGAASEAAGSASSAVSSAVADGSVVAKAKVPVGSGYVDTIKQVVVSQPKAGEFKAFSSICTHEGCPMTRIDGSAIVCACHGSAFSLADGSVTNGPADQPLPAKSVTAEGDNLKIS